MRLSEVLLKEIKRRGIKYIFGVPGRENENILFNEAEGLEYITARVEFNAGIMADFSGRMGHIKPQVCFSTMGPGVTNMTTAVASAMLNSSPLILISAQVESNDMFYNETHQCVDQASIMETVTKWSYQLKSPDEIKGVIDKAFQIVMQEPVGPVHIAIPNDFFKANITIDYDIEKPIVPQLQIPKSNVTKAILKKANNLIINSKNPVCLIGSHAVRCGYAQDVLAFCEKWNIPFIMAANAKGLAPFDHPLNLGSASCYMEGILDLHVLKEIFEPADLIICFNYRYVDDLLPKMWQYGDQKRIITISTSFMEKARAKINPDIELVGDVAEVIKNLSTAAVSKIQNGVTTHIKNQCKKVLEEDAVLNNRLLPGQVVNVINRYLDDGMLVTDIGYYRHHAILLTEPKATGRYFTDTGISTFGTGLPSAIAAQLHNPQKTVFLIAGDGGFHSGSCDLETVARLNLPMVIIILNNSSFELINLYQKRGDSTPNPKILKFSRVDFAKLAEANGIAGYHANTIEDVDRLIKERDKTQPILIEIPLRYEDEKFEISF